MRYNVGDWNKYVPLAIAGIFIYVIGIPLWCFRILYNAANYTSDGISLEEKKKTDPDAQSAMESDPIVVLEMGFLFHRFKSIYYFFEILNMLQKVLLCGVVTNLIGGIVNPTMVALGIVLVYIILYLNVWPYKTFDDNLVECMVIAGELVTLYGMLLAQGRIDITDNYGPGVLSAILLTPTIFLLVIFTVILLRIQLPWICAFAT